MGRQVEDGVPSSLSAGLQRHLSGISGPNELLTRLLLRQRLGLGLLLGFCAVVREGWNVRLTKGSAQILQYCVLCRDMIGRLVI